MKGNIMKIMVLGDEGVGKTSLICAMISDLAS
jgi:GTPase SAR1 family protein